MLARLFRSNQPAVLAGLAVLVPVLFGKAFLLTPGPVGDVMPLYAWVLRMVGSAAWLNGLVVVVVVALLSVQLAALADHADLADRRNHLAALLFPLLLAAFSRTISVHPALLGMPLVLWALRRGWSISNTGAALGPLFDAGLLMGLAALFYLPYAFLVVVLWASVSVIRPFHWREYVVPLVACAVVFYVAWALQRLAGSVVWHPLHTILEPTSEREAAPWPRGHRILVYTVLAPLLLVSLSFFASSYQRGIMQVKNLRSSYLALAAALGVIMLGVRLLNGTFPAVLLAVPLAVLLVHALLGDRRAWLREAAVLGLISAALWAQWWT